MRKEKRGINNVKSIQLSSKKDEDIGSCIQMHENKSSRREPTVLAKKIILWETFLFDSKMRIKSGIKLEEIKNSPNLKLAVCKHLFLRDVICVLLENKERIGYVPRRDASAIAKLLNAGKILTAHLRNETQIENGRRVEIKIYLREAE